MESKRLILIAFRWADNVLARIDEEKIPCKIKFDGQSLKIVAEGEAADRIETIDREESEKFLYPEEYCQRLLSDENKLRDEMLRYFRGQRKLYKQYRELFYENQQLRKKLEKYEREEKV